MSKTCRGLAHLIDPIDIEEFMRAHWETAPLIVSRQQPDYYHDLLTLADVDRVLSLPSRSPSVRVLREGAEVSVAQSGQVASAETIYEQFRNGCTISLQFLQERLPALAQLCRSLAVEFSASFQANAYLTPAHERGLATHYDTHDVFVLQVAGVKHWRLFEGPTVLPLPGQKGLVPTADQSTLTAEFDLHPGDAIYIPRGFAHDARSLDTVSLHVTVGVRPITWAFAMLAAVEAAVEQDPLFRESLPIGFADDTAVRRATEARLSEVLDIFRKQVDIEGAVENAVAVARHRIDPSLSGHLLDLDSLSRVGPDTRIRRRSAVWTDGGATEGKAEVAFLGKRLRVPDFVAVDLEYISRTESFTARDLPGVLDESGRLVLIRRLVREGLLSVSS